MLLYTYLLFLTHNIFCSSYVPQGSNIFLQYRTTNILNEEILLEIHSCNRKRETKCLKLKYDKS